MTGKVVNWIKDKSGIMIVWDWFKHYFGGLYDRVDRHHIFLLAGGLAFSLFICIIPLILIVFSVVGQILEKQSVWDEINVFIDRAIPYQDYADFVKQMVFERVEEFRLYKSLAGLIGFVGLFFASSGLFSSMRTVLNLVYKIKVTEHALIGKLRDFGMVLLVLIYFVLTTAFLPAINIFQGMNATARIFEDLNLKFLEELAFSGFSFTIVLVAFLILYWLIPHGRLPKKSIFLSAFWAAVMWEVAKQLFGMYMSHAATLQRVYGAYIFLIAVIFWIYYSAIVFIVGAEIGQLHRERAADRSSPIVN
ncbi:MAG: YihY/virulence factor BrkB family protein [Candidatus Zixiibacteriota bacterium]